MSLNKTSSLNDRKFYNQLNIDQIVDDVRTLHNNDYTNIIDNLFFTNNIIQSCDNIISDANLKDILITVLISNIPNNESNNDILNRYYNNNINEMLNNIKNIAQIDYNKYVNKKETWKLIPVCFYILHMFSYCNTCDIINKHSKDEILKLYNKYLEYYNKYNQIINMTSYTKYMYDLQFNHITKIRNYVKNTPEDNIDYESIFDM